MTDSVVIVGAARTPMGAFMGDLKTLSAVELGVVSARAALRSSGISPSELSECYFGCVLPAGLGQAPARQVLLGAGGSQSVPCATINKVCGSGMKSLQLGEQSLRLGESDYVLVGGMESMSRVPHLLCNSRAGVKMGHQQVLDHMLKDGLEDVTTSKLMGQFADATAQRYGLTREQQDAYALQSSRASKQAQEQGRFAGEIAAVEVGAASIDEDEGPKRVREEKIASLKPAFSEGGTVTAANASSLADGAAALVLARETSVRDKGIAPLARIVAIEQHAQAPEWFTTAPVGAIQKLMLRTGLKANDIDLYEINEAFAVVPLVCMKELGIEREQLNVNGGACALGHPLGASGARIIVTLAHALKARKGTYGIASLCIGGGEAMAILVEAL
jgi:acetyl-CoA C-acetyltransferase